MRGSEIGPSTLALRHALRWMRVEFQRQLDTNGASCAPSRRHHNPVRLPNPGRFQVAPVDLRWNNYGHNSYSYDHRLPQPFAYRYGVNPWRAPHFRTLREALPRRSRQDRSRRTRRVAVGATAGAALRAACESAVRAM